MKSALMPHHFLGVDPDGRISVYRTKGNRYGHVVLRGGKSPNYDESSIALVRKALHAAGLPERIMVDCSHGNSSKDHRRQPAVFAAGTSNPASASPRMAPAETLARFINALPDSGAASASAARMRLRGSVIRAPGGEA